MEADAQWFVALCLEKQVLQPAQWTRVQNVLGRERDILKIAETIVQEKICEDEILLQELIYSATDKAKAGSKPPPVPGAPARRRSLTEMLAEMAESAKGRSGSAEPTADTDATADSGTEAPLPGIDGSNPTEGNGPAPQAEAAEPETGPTAPEAKPVMEGEDGRSSEPATPAAPAEPESEPDDEDPDNLTAKLGRQLARESWASPEQAQAWLADLLAASRNGDPQAFLLQAGKPVLTRSAAGSWQPLHPEVFKADSLEDLVLFHLTQDEQETLAQDGQLVVGIQLGNGARLACRVGPAGLSVGVTPCPKDPPRADALGLPADAWSGRAGITLLLALPGLEAEQAREAVAADWIEADDRLVATTPLRLHPASSLAGHPRLLTAGPLTARNAARWLDSLLDLGAGRLLLDSADPAATLAAARRAAAAGCRVLATLPVASPEGLAGLLADAGQSWERWLAAGGDGLTGVLVAPAFVPDSAGWQWLPVTDENREDLRRQGPAAWSP